MPRISSLVHKSLQSFASFNSALGRIHGALRYPHYILNCSKITGKTVLKNVTPHVPSIGKAQYSISLKNGMVFKDGFVISCIPENSFKGNFSSVKYRLTIIRGGGCGTEDMDVPRKLAHVTDFKPIEHKKVILVDQAWGYNYYHFINEAFMRLFQYNNIKDLVKDKNQYFILPKSGHFNGAFGDRKFVEEIFGVMGVAKNRLITINGNQGLLVKHLEIPKPIYCGNPQIEQLQKAQSYFWDEISRKALESVGEGNLDEQTSVFHSLEPNIFELM